MDTPARRDDWKTNPMPERKQELCIELIVPDERFNELRQGFVPQQMEDRWFYFMEGDWLHLHRSWTGNCIYQIRFDLTDGAHRVAEVWVNRDPEQYPGKDDDDVQWISNFLRLWR